MLLDLRLRFFAAAGKSDKIKQSPPHQAQNHHHHYYRPIFHYYSFPTDNLLEIHLLNMNRTIMTKDHWITQVPRELV